jgi:DNA-directed RNA polymerase subunit M/transcription elongation factor TFIIS
MSESAPSAPAVAPLHCPSCGNQGHTFPLSLCTSHERERRLDVARSALEGQRVWGEAKTNDEPIEDEHIVLCGQCDHEWPYFDIDHDRLR